MQSPDSYDDSERDEFCEVQMDTYLVNEEFNFSAMKMKYLVDVFGSILPEAFKKTNEDLREVFEIVEILRSELGEVYPSKEKMEYNRIKQKSIASKLMLRIKLLEEKYYKAIEYLKEKLRGRHVLIQLYENDSGLVKLKVDSVEEMIVPKALIKITGVNDNGSIISLEMLPHMSVFIPVSTDRSAMN